MGEESKTPIWYWIVGAFALLWNGAGVAAYIGQTMMSAADFANLSQVEQDLFSSRPYWVTAAFAIAVFGGFAGAIALLLRKRIAVRLFILSLVAVLVQFASYFILDGYLEYIGTQGWIMPISIPIIAILLVLFSRYAERNGILS